MNKLIFVALAFFSTAAFASRPDTRDFSCADAKAIVEQNGAIVLTTGDTTYDRYVANSSYCDSGDKAVSAYVPTLNKSKCNIGYVCRDHESNGTEIVGAKYVCSNGDTTTFKESNGISDHMEAVPYVCKNGKWKPVHPKAKKTWPKCEDGDTSTGSETVSNGSSDHDKTVYFKTVCENGVWHKM
jgi:hypothetical protein